MRVLFDPPQLPDGAMVKYQVSNSAPLQEVGILQSLDLAINELSIIGDRYRGTATNTAGVDAWGGSVLLMCFDPDGAVTATGVGMVDLGQILSGADGSFSVAVPAACDSYIVAAGT